MGIDAVHSSLVYQTVPKAESSEVPQNRPVAEADKTDNQAGNRIRRDEYISSGKPADEQTGLYKEKPAGKSEECTVNTDKVDREIEKLKEKKEQLLKQLQSASGDEEKMKELKRQLSGVENELNQKNNDTYRRQNAEVS